MQLQNFECQIAKAQIGRYVAGDMLSDEAVSQLEAHVAKCPECKQNLSERRAVLQAMLSPGQTETQETVISKSKFDLAQFIKSKVQSRQPIQAVVQSETKPSTFTKPAIYSIALGAVLIGMSYLSKNVGVLLGPKAAEVAPKSAPVRTEPLPKSTWPAPVISRPAPALKDKPAAKMLPPLKAQPKTSTVAPPKTEAVVTPKPDRSSNRHKPKHSKKAPRPKSDGIRIYAPEK